MPAMDVFNGDGFSMRSLTAAINVPQYAPTRIAELGIFEEQGVTTNKVSVERLAQPVSLVQSTSRGGAPAEVANPMRTMYDLNTVRVALGDTIYADEIQGIRNFGSESMVQSLAEEVNRRNQAMAANVAATIEYQRFTALQGNTKDADGTSLVNTNSVFGTTNGSSVEIDTNSTGLRTDVSTVIRAIESGLDGRPYTSIHAFVDAAFFDNLMDNDEIKDSWKYTQGAALRDRTAGRTLDFAGILFEEYRPLAGSNPLSTGTGIAFPIGSGIFQTRFGPSDSWDAVNTMGLPMYARQYADVEGDRFRRLEVQTNVLNVCTDSSCVIPLDDGQ
jgi:hypothetical protein